MWSGLVVSGINSVIVCVIGVHTSQYGFIPANVFCICIYMFNVKSWLKDRSTATVDSIDSIDSIELRGEVLRTVALLHTQRPCLDKNYEEACRHESETGSSRVHLTSAHTAWLKSDPTF